ncbi:hypothetical protein ACQY0O_005956 [Thecaphora frezii]
MSGDRPIPKAGATLSERIAALQRKTSNPVPTRSGGLSPGSSHDSSSGRLSPGDSPSRLSVGSTKGVRDRIAKFQGTDDRPLIPRSSFGVGAPNPELIGGMRRGYLGTSAKGSGAWGEGVLRPQMTGGVWLGGGSGGGWGDPTTAPMRPQLTGGAFLNGGGRTPSFGLGSSRMQRGASSEIVHGSGRDAFADLGPDIILTGRNKPESPESSPTKTGSPSGSLSPSSNARKDGLPELPDPPATDIDPTKVQQPARDGLPATDVQFIIPEFPTTPSAAPETPKKSGNGQLPQAQSTPDTSIEIGVHGRSPEDVEKLRKKARDLELEEKRLSAVPIKLDTPGDGPGGEVPRPIDPDELVAAASPSSQGQDEPWVQGYGRPSADIDALATAEATDSKAEGDLLRAQVERIVSDKVDPSDPNAYKVMGASLLVPRDEVAEAKEAGTDAVKAPLSSETGSGAAGAGTAASSSGSAAAGTSGPTPTRSFAENGSATPTLDSAASKSGPASPSIIVTSSNSNGAIAASTSGPVASGMTANDVGANSHSSSSNERPSTPCTPHSGATSATPPPTSSKELSPAEQARQAVAEARTKSKGKGSSQRLRRPPPGTVLSAADLDASDDDYEPGWASVISSSRS